MKLSNERYKVFDNVMTYEGKLAEVIMYLELELNVAIEEIEFALTTMSSQKHDTAHFGVNFAFTHSSNSNSVSHVVADLRAIRALRMEFKDACERFGDSIESRESHARLISLYSALNVDAVLQLVDPIGESKAA